MAEFHSGNKEEIENVTLPDDRSASKTPEPIDNSLFRDYLSRISPESSPLQLSTRQFRLGSVMPKFCSNRICTSKYSLFTWAPKSLLYQFRRAANIYFLIISALSFMSFSPKTPVSMAGTFTAVLLFTMLKEAYEDYFRHKQDRTANTSPVKRFDFTQKRYVTTFSAGIQVGDILKITQNEQIPADMVLLSTSNHGLAFVNTMNLDGETNLKEKISPEMTKNSSETDYFFSNLELQCDLPNSSLVKWNCNIRVNGANWCAVGLNQLLLRGCILKNTDSAIGIVTYTGHDTKIMLNSKPAPSKMSKILRKMNKMLYTVFAFQGVICLLFAGLYVSWSVSHVNGHVYLDISDHNPGRSYFVQVLTFLVAYSHLIPISLYVALEVMKLALAYLISQDEEMYYQEEDRPASCRTSDLVEELGQVEFVFSDKTGTLTCNEMVFRECSINGVKYGGGEKVQGQYGVGADTEPYRILESLSDSQDKLLISRFFTQLAICHSVFSTENPDVPGTYLYQAASPDELALVQGSSDMGYVFSSKDNNRISLQIREKMEEIWEVLAEIPFNSTRKRMTVLVKEPQTGKFLVMLKGADSVVFPLLTPHPRMSSFHSHLTQFAKSGLRTLLIAQKYVSTSEITPWLHDYHNLLLSNASNKDELMDKHAELIEKDLDLLGITAIEDKLQEKVPETIELLIKAGIKVWVLTGDKQETAVEIGRMSQLIRNNAVLIDLSSTSLLDFHTKIEHYAGLYVTFK